MSKFAGLAILIPERLVRYVACCACAGDGGECDGHAFVVVREGRATMLMGDESSLRRASDDIRGIAEGSFLDAIERADRDAARRWVARTKEPKS
jgi:hypothetical protein